MMIQTKRDPLPGDDVTVEILAKNKGLQKYPLTIRCKVSSVNPPMVSFVFSNWIPEKSSCENFFFDGPIESISVNYTILSEEADKTNKEYEKNLLKTAKVMPIAKVEYVVWGGEAISIEDLEENLHECLPSERPEEVFVALKRPLTINKLETYDYTARWDDLFYDVEDDIVWDGIEEFDQAVQSFHQAIDLFEQKNLGQYSVHTSKMSKIVVADLGINFDDKEISDKQGQEYDS